MLDDILNFAAVSLVDEGRLSLWMPTANDEEVELGIPMHPCLEVVSVCVQAFNKCKYILKLECGPLLVLTKRALFRVKEAFDV